MQYCFHHIPKTAGSTLQLLLAHREHIGELPTGSTLVVYPLYDKTRLYRVSNDPDFDPQEPIKQAFLRTYNRDNSVGNANIVMGHYTNVSQPGDHYVWLRHPLERDISHFNYDCKYGNQLSQNFATHLSAMSGNFMTLWLYGKYLGRHDSVSMEQRYNTVREALKTKFKKVPKSKNGIPLIYLRGAKNRKAREKEIKKTSELYRKGKLTGAMMDAISKLRSKG